MPQRSAERRPTPRTEVIRTAAPRLDERHLMRSDGEVDPRSKDDYGLVARFYDRVLEPVNAPLRAVARRLHPTSPGSVVLDLGCGTGAALAEYQRAGCTVLGTDPSPAMLEVARGRLGPGADLRILVDGRAPFDDGCADTILIALVLHSVDRATAVDILVEAGRLLAPGGRILVTDFGTGQLRFPRGWLSRGFAIVAEALAGPTHARNSLSYARAGGLQPLVDASGLVAETTRPTAGGSVVIAVLHDPSRRSAVDRPDRYSE